VALKRTSGGYGKGCGQRGYGFLADNINEKQAADQSKVSRLFCVSHPAFVDTNR